jgi:hypothetical protein
MVGLRCGRQGGCSMYGARREATDGDTIAFVRYLVLDERWSGACIRLTRQTRFLLT